MSTHVDVRGELRDIPLGVDGLRGRLLVRHTEGRWEVARYRGVKRRARERVAGAATDELKGLYESSSEVERSTGSSSDLADALGKALDLPALDQHVEQIVRYLEATS